jgi:PAS domain S-box-containing protein
MHRALQLSSHEALLHSIVEGIPARVFWKDLESRYLGCNALFAKDAGLNSPDELIGKTDFDMAWKDQAESYRADDKAIMDSGISRLGYEEQQTTPAGVKIWLRTSKVPLRDANRQVIGVLGLYEDITEYASTKETEKRLARALKLLSKCNMLLVHAKNEAELLSEICHLAVEIGGYRMAWVGFIEHDAKKTVIPVAQAGIELDYLKTLNVTWDDSLLGLGPTGMAIKNKITNINQDYRNNPRVEPWRESAIENGYQSSISLPLLGKEEVLGALTIYSSEPYAFEWDETKLLEELAEDLAYGIEALRLRAAHDVIEKQLELSNRQLQVLTIRREEAREDERKRIARDLHDELGQILTSLRMDIALLRVRFGVGNPDLVDQVKDILGHVDSTIQVVRNVAAKLRPSVLNLGIVAAIEWQVAEFAKRSDIEFALSVAEQNIELDDERATVIFRIVQESLTNVVRHANAQKVNISLNILGADYLLEIADNGKGFEPENSSKRTYGLMGIRERALMLGGSININSALGQGTQITVHIPIQKGTKQ